MNAILDEPSIRASVSRMTVEEYHQLPEFNANGRRTELIRGIVFEKMPHSPLHGTIVSLLMEMVALQLPTGFCAREEKGLTLSDSEPEPDICVVTGSIRDYFHVHPSTALWTIEVSVTTYALDQQKALLYAEAGIPEFWIVLPKSLSVEVHRRPEGGTYSDVQTYRTPATIECASVPGVKVALADLFAGLELA